MGNRLSKIITKTGDAGTTGLGDGSRVIKTSARIHALGDIDELNSFVGLLLAEELPPDIRTILTSIQNQLFDLGGEICIPGVQSSLAPAVKMLEDTAAKINEGLTPLKEFILPGGSRAAALCHVIRTVTRRAERSLVSLKGQDIMISRETLQYINRLSDLMFILARELNRAANQPDVLWSRAA